MIGLFHVAILFNGVSMCRLDVFSVCRSAMLKIRLRESEVLSVGYMLQDFIDSCGEINF